MTSDQIVQKIIDYATNAWSGTFSMGTGLGLNHEFVKKIQHAANALPELLEDDTNKSWRYDLDAKPWSPAKRCHGMGGPTMFGKLISDAIEAMPRRLMGQMDAQEHLMRYGIEWAVQYYRTIPESAYNYKAGYLEAMPEYLRGAL